METRRRPKDPPCVSVFPLDLAPGVHLVQTRGRQRLLQLAELRVGAGGLLLQLLQVEVDGVQLGLTGRDRQVAPVPGKTHAPAGARQVQLAVLERLLQQPEVHHVGGLAHVHQKVPEGTAQHDAQQLGGAEGRGCTGE